MTTTDLRFGMFLSPDFATVRPDPGDAEVLRRVATEIIPELRAGRLLD